MDSSTTKKKAQPQTVTVEYVNRLLEVGCLLFSVLTPKEIEALQAEVIMFSTSEELGNAGDS